MSDEGKPTSGLQMAQDIAQAKIDKLALMANDQRNMGAVRKAAEIGYAVSHLANLRDTLKEMIESPSAVAFQARVQPWMMACFGAEISADIAERCHRLYEEVGETVQSFGMSRSEAHQLVDYTWDRAIGQRAQEVGGVMVTLAALCLAAGLDMHECGETELARIWTKVDVIRAKQAAKPKHSPLPENWSSPPKEPADG